MKNKEKITNYMTETSAVHWDYLIQENLTAKEAVNFLKSDMKLRTFADNLTEFYHQEDLEKRLIAGFVNDTGGKEDSIRRKVQNWMQNKNLPSGRDELFHICFILGLDEEESDFLLKRLDGQGIHCRDTEELIYAYCLKCGISYTRAKELVQELVQEELESGQEDVMTAEVREKFRLLKQEEDLLQFILEQKSLFGKYHNTAYRYFHTMLGLLTKEGGEQWPLEDAVDCYLRLQMPSNKRTAGYSDIQKLVKKHWPGSRSIKAMKNRKQDVTRKTLLLLYLVTGGIYEESYEESDEEYVTDEEILEYHCKAMNRMLSECGMARIDPRNAFDFLVLYSARPQEDMFMSDRMAEVVAELYSE